MQVDAAVHFPRDGRADHVDQADGAGAAALGLADGGQRIGRLARLGDPDDQACGCPPPGFGSGTRRRTRPRPASRAISSSMYSPMIPECQDVPHAVMITRSNCLSSSSVRFRPVTRAVPFFLEQVAAQRVAEALRLLADLLEHEVRVAAPLHLGQIPIDLVDLLADPGGLQVAHPVAFASQHRHLAVVQVDHRAGVLQQRGGIGGDEPLVLADARPAAATPCGRRPAHRARPTR